MEVDGDLIHYRCPECGQHVEMGINSDRTMKFHYPEGTTIEQQMDHKHIYPTYLDVEYFSQRGMDVPAVQFTNALKQAHQKAREDLENLDGNEG